MSTQSQDPNQPYRSLFERLKVVGDELPVSHLVDHTPVGRVLSALIHYAEHGEDLLDAADQAVEHFTAGLRKAVDARTIHTGVPEILNAPYPQPVDAAADSAEMAGQIAALQQQIAALQGAQHAGPGTTVDVQPVPDAPTPGTPLEPGATWPQQPAGQPAPGWPQPPTPPAPDVPTPAAPDAPTPASPPDITQPGGHA